MAHLDPLYILVGVQAVSLGLIVWGLLVMRRVKSRVDSIGAHQPTEATAELVKYWRGQMNRYPRGSAKHKAYRKRLIECGAINNGD